MESPRIRSRSPHGERGLKYRPRRARAPPQRRSPHGERGLKCSIVEDVLLRLLVALLTESVD